MLKDVIMLGAVTLTMADAARESLRIRQLSLWTGHVAAARTHICERFPANQVRLKGASKMSTMNNEVLSKTQNHTNATQIERTLEAQFRCPTLIVRNERYE